jgi:uncharacterized Fe-S radical SAM superfamily protein PflX
MRLPSKFTHIKRNMSHFYVTYIQVFISVYGVAVLLIMPKHVACCVKPAAVFIAFFAGFNLTAFELHPW